MQSYESHHGLYSGKRGEPLCREWNSGGINDAREEYKQQAKSTADCIWMWFILQCNPSGRCLLQRHLSKRENDLIYLCQLWVLEKKGLGNWSFKASTHTLGCAVCCALQFSIRFSWIWTPFLQRQGCVSTFPCWSSTTDQGYVWFSKRLPLFCRHVRHHVNH